MYNRVYDLGLLLGRLVRMLQCWTHALELSRVFLMPTVGGPDGFVDDEAA